MSSGFVDLRSDTVTKPTAKMRRAMADAEVGDDQYGEDPTVNALEEAYAARVGKPAALFVPSGVMANQIALRVLCRPGALVIAGRRQHVVIYEHGAAARNAGTLPALEAVAWAAHGLPIHMDGARLFNAEVATGTSASAFTAPVTTVMSCLSKGLCAPVGSILAGPSDVMAEARLERHRLGGAMRQAGVIAAAGLLALRTMVDRLADDHARAQRLAHAVAERPSFS